MSAQKIDIVYVTPRRLPKPQALRGRVAVLDIGFAAGTRKISYEKITGPFIERLGERLAIWIDHHQHEKHALYASDPRFVFGDRAEHRACAEMVTPERVMQAGPVETICCHIDFDGLCSAAKWLRGGNEPYPGADQDARAIDTRIGEPSERANVIDRALRARPRSDALDNLVVAFLAEGAPNNARYRELREVAEELAPLEQIARELAAHYEVRDGVAVVNASIATAPYDKTALSMAGQELAPVAVVFDRTTVTAAARFDSGIDLIKILGLAGGMPTVVSLPVQFLDNVLSQLHFRR